MSDAADAEEVEMGDIGAAEAQPLLDANGGLLFGYDQGVVSVILVMPQFLDRFGEIAEGNGYYKGLLTAMITIGALFGAINQGWLADAISRKYSIVVAVIIFNVGSMLQAASTDFTMLTVARFIGGIGIGMLSMVAPLYISEISPPEIRGTLLVLEELSIVTGIVVAFWITYGTRFITSEWSYRLPFLLQVLPALGLGIGTVYLPFSPRWLVSQGRDNEALQALSILRQLPPSNVRVQYEWHDIRAEVAFHRDIATERHPHLQSSTLFTRARLELASWADLFGEECLRRTIVGSGLMFFQQFVGINALIYYSPTLFATMGLNYDMQLIMSGVLNMAQLVGVMTSLWSMDRLGRRPLLLSGSAVMFVTHLVIALLVGSYAYDWSHHRTEGWVSVAMLLLYMLAFGASWGPVPWAMPAEIFNSASRAKGTAFSTSCNWLFNAIIGLITPPLVERTGYGAYVFFATFCLLSLIWTYLFVPETAGKTLEQMDEVFGDTSTHDHQKRQRYLRNEISTSTLNS
ncbi:hypothetical protein B0A48_12623 [Cryoendolithus antarcticus]|uniref:Major facilitator superfamily (MFS) profile domain-containing protein n=1 Tax=Cryoendolithus antarcticus TaxID=1507870 RepID=A0A1V8SQX8_9PEZI|nr:hypothetical protein B0A48_12623 [Cryoendolithus antarcticus]